MVQQIKLCIAAAAGILSHNLIFIHNEHHIQAPRLFRFFLLLSLLLFVGEARIWALNDSGQAARASALMVLSYSVSLFTSIAIYRIFFHRLRKFPGPIGARVSKFWHVGKLLGQPNFKVLDELHQQYGDFVRTGERRSTIINAEILLTNMYIEAPMRSLSVPPPQWPQSTAPAADAPKHHSTTYSFPEPPS